MTSSRSTQTSHDRQPAAGTPARRLSGRTRARTGRLLAGIVAAIVLGGPAALPAGAEPAGGANHIVSAVASADNPDVTHSGLQVASVGAPTVSSANVARAISHDCTGCRAAAAAFQAVLITRNATTITPNNLAAAANVNCTGCDSFAFAYQYVVTTPGPVDLTADARRQIAGLRQDVADAIDSDMPDDQLDARLQSLAAQFKSTIDQDVRQAGMSPHGSVREHDDMAPATS